MDQRQYNLELLRNALFARCKALWGAGLVAKFLVFALGTVVVFVPVHAKPVAIFGLVLAAGSEFLQWLSDRWKSAAQQLHRKLDLENSFGWEIGEREVKDFLARYAGDVEAFSSPSAGNYFASAEQPGARRAVENLRESAWWSMHLAETMWWVSITMIGLIFVACIFLLNVSVQEVSQASAHAITTAQNQGPQSPASPSAPLPPAVSASVVKVVTSAMLFIFSYGLFKFATGYFSFSSKSRQVADKAEMVLSNGAVDEVQAIKLWQDYHLARDAAPLLPNWIWQLREKKLNKLWKA